jgi:hypothetical protein
MQESGPASSAAVPCIGDGTSGNRVQVVSGRSPTIPDRYASLLPAFRQWAAQVDQAVWLSAGETGGGRHLRRVTDSACQLQVAQVLVTPAGEASFDQMRTELQGLATTAATASTWSGWTPPSGSVGWGSR